MNGIYVDYGVRRAVHYGDKDSVLPKEHNKEKGVTSRPLPRCTRSAPYMYASPLRSALPTKVLFHLGTSRTETRYSESQKRHGEGKEKGTKSEADDALWTNGESNPGPFPGRKLNHCQVCWRG